MPNSIKDNIIKNLHTVYDPEIPVDIYELGLIYDLKVNSKGLVDIIMTLTSPNCPVAEILPEQVKTAAKKTAPKTSSRKKQQQKNQ